MCSCVEIKQIVTISVPILQITAQIRCPHPCYHNQLTLHTRAYYANSKVPALQKIRLFRYISANIACRLTGFFEGINL